jgi:hypothetical protein
MVTACCFYGHVFAEAGRKTRALARERLNGILLIILVNTVATIGNDWWLWGIVPNMQRIASLLWMSGEAFAIVMAIVFVLHFLHVPFLLYRDKQVGLRAAAQT